MRLAPLFSLPPLLLLLHQLPTPTTACIDPHSSHLHRRSTSSSSSNTTFSPLYDHGDVHGPVVWGTLNHNYTTCATGRHQTPIMLFSPSPSSPPDPSAAVQIVPEGSLHLAFDDHTPSAETKHPIRSGKPAEARAGATATVSHEGWTVQTSFEGVNVTLSLSPPAPHGDGRPCPVPAVWTLEQFHVHTPSEHHIDHDSGEGELHFVFSRPSDPFAAKLSRRSLASSSKSYLVVAVLLHVTDRTPTPMQHHLAALYRQLPTLSGPTQQYVHPHGGELLAALRTTLRASAFWHYRGSFTTPPCTEGVEWYVATRPLSVGLRTYRSLKRITRANARFVQAPPGEENLLKRAASVYSGAVERGEERGHVESH